MSLRFHTNTYKQFSGPDLVLLIRNNSKTFNLIVIRNYIIIIICLAASYSKQAEFEGKSVPNLS